MTERLRVAVVGAGIGTHHVYAYQGLPDQFDVVAVCDIDQDKARDMAEKCNVPRVFFDLDELCRVDELDVIDVCTPSHLHYPHTLQVLEAGKHVICEKPVAGSLKEADELIATEAKSDKRIMPIFQYRFGHGLQKL